MTVKNCIITANTSYGVYRYSASGTANVEVSYSDVWNNGTNFRGATAGTGCLAANPLFVSPPTDLSLQSTSFCVDSGNAAGAPDHERNGLPRPQNGGLGELVDM